LAVLLYSGVNDTNHPFKSQQFFCFFLAFLLIWQGKV
jgi:hypothetical protein